MARKVKCPQCGQYFDRSSEPAVEHKNRWYHQKCFDAFWEVESARLELIDFILRLFKIKAPGPKIYAQINRYLDQSGFTYRGILQALQYFYEVLGKSTEKSNSGIGIVPYVYLEAQTHFQNKENRDQRVLSQVAQYKKVVDKEGKHIVIKKEKITERKKHQPKHIDIDSI